MDTLMEHVRNGPDGADGAVLLGDLNEWLPTLWAGSPLRVDPAPVVATGRTWPSRAPALMLDRVLVWPASARVEHRVVRSRSARLASDHLPVAADIAWDGGGPRKKAHKRSLR
jgi:endonuclease/exonuclease/phosphatase family metal-dependent hydrolase